MRQAVSEDVVLFLALLRDHRFDRAAEHHVIAAKAGIDERKKKI
jgi:hypothetical protein